MKLRISLLLYLVSLGLFGFAGWTVYEAIPLSKDSERQAAEKRGQDEARDCLNRTKGRGAIICGPDRRWIETLEKANLVGRVPPQPKVQDGAAVKPAALAVDVRPLEEIIELVSLVHDGEAEGRGGDTHVIVRYKPAADVKPPESYMRANTTPLAGAGVPVVAHAVASGRAGGPGSRRGGQPVPTPTSMAGREILQRLWVRDDGDARHGSHLWPPFDHIKLVGVSCDAQVAWFVRVLPPAKEGEAPPEPKEEALLKTNMHVSWGPLQEISCLPRLAERAANTGTAVLSPNAGNAWIDLPETGFVNGVLQISRKDADRFRANLDELFSHIHVDTYKGHKVTGLIVRNVDAKLAATFGVAAGEVLIEINGRPVRSKSEAMEIGKNDYKRGVRRFVTKWLADGAVVERKYQAPDR